MERYLSVPEAATYLNTSERFIRRLIAERRVAFHKVGKHVRFRLSDLDDWLGRNRVEAFNPSDARRAWRRAS